MKGFFLWYGNFNWWQIFKVCSPDMKKNTTFFSNSYFEIEYTTKMTVQFFLWFQNIFFYCSRMFSWFCIIQIKHTTFMIYTNMYLFSIGIQSIIQKYIHEKYRFDIIHKMIFFKKKSLRLAKILLLLQFIQKPQFVAWWADISNIQTFKKTKKIER